MALAALLPACDWMPGKPTQAQAWHSPHSVLDFGKLYAENCRGCHGTKEEPSGAITLDNPTYIAVIPRDTLRSIIADGVTGTDGLLEEHGGMLTEKQIDVLVEGIAALGAKNPPPGPLPAYSGPWATWPKARLHSARSAQVAMAPTGPAAKPAPWCTRHISVWSAINICGRSLLRDAMTSAALIFRIAFRQADVRRGNFRRRGLAGLPEKE